MFISAKGHTKWTRFCKTPLEFSAFLVYYVTFTHAAYSQDLTFLALSFNPEI